MGSFNQATTYELLTHSSTGTWSEHRAPPSDWDKSEFYCINP